jgi:hypothetical protein
MVKKGLSSTVLKPVATRLAETAWPARSRFAYGAGDAAGAEKTPASDDDQSSAGARSAPISLPHLWKAAVAPPLSRSDDFR